MKTSKKIGLTAFIISEIIIIIFAGMMLFKVGKDKAKISDMDIILLAQAGILTAVWGSQAGVNFAKNKYQIKKEP